MSLIPLKLPPGVFRNGTDYETKGRYFDSDLIRWFEGSLQPIGGWRKIADTSEVDVSAGNPIRGLFGWRSNVGIAYLALGTFEKAYAYALGVLTEITPAGFTEGTKDATTATGTGAYGDGDYGAGPYGGVVTDTRNQITEAGSWQFDAFGELLIANAFPDGKIYSWDLDVGNDLEQLTNSPSAHAIVVTPERFIVALGVGGDRRTVEWADQESTTVWDLGVGVGSQAGDFPLPGSGEIMFGRRARTETLIFTSTDLWAMRFIGGDLVYSFQQIGSNCGAISRHCAAEAGAVTYWMTKRGFYRYDGAVQPLPSDVGDFVFDDINWLQMSKITATAVSEFGEIYWFYPSAGSDENDRYVAYNYLIDTWSIGTLSRTSGIDRGAHQFPIMSDATGAIYEHEQGTSYLSPAGVAKVPFAETGPIELGSGDQVYTITYIIPDDKTVGDVDATLTLQFFPDEVGTTFGPFNLSKQTSLRKTARMVRLKLRQVQPNWRVGIIRLDVVPGGRR